MVRSDVLKWGLCALAVSGLACPAALAQRDTTREEAVTIGLMQADHAWTCKEDNRVLPDGCSGTYECRFSANTLYYGVAYLWGGWDSSQEFEQKLALPVAAGGIQLWGACATGTDCSGLVSICWGFSEKMSTTGLAASAVSWNPPWSKVTHGDALINPGSHAMLVTDAATLGYVNVVEATWTDARVVRRLYPISTLAVSYSVYSAKRWYTPGSPFLYAYLEEDGTLSWRVTTEIGIAYYVLMGSSDAQSWSTVQVVQPAGPAYSHYGGNSGWAHMLIVAVQQNGREAEILCAPRVAPKVQIAARPVAVCAPATPEPTEDAASIALTGACTIIAPAAWYRVVNDLAGYWRLQCGYTVYEHYMPDTWSYYVTPDADTDACRNEVRGIIAADVALGAKYVLLVGGANDWREIATARAQELWVGEYWQAKLQYLRENTLFPDGQPSKDIMPTWIVPSPGMVGSDFPYFGTDLPYADVFGNDGLPDVVVARIPCDDNTELAAYVEKLRAYDSCSSNAVNATFLSGTSISSRYTGTPYGELMELSESELLSVLPDFPGTWRIESRDLWDQMGELYPAGIARLWTQMEPSVVVLQATGSGRYFPASALNTDNMEALQGAHNAVVLAASCGTGDFMHTEWNGADPDVQRPICERMLARSNGAIMWIGPTANEFQSCGSDLAKEYLVEQQANPDRPVAENFIVAQRSALLRAVQDYEKYTIATYAILGSPVMHLRNSANGGTTGVIGGDEREVIGMYPSPSSSGIMITHSAKKGGLVELSVYDMRGRRVRSIASWSDVNGHMYWDGCGDDGGRVASGAYVMVVKTPNSTTERKVTLCR